MKHWQDRTVLSINTHGNDAYELTAVCHMLI